MTSDVLYDAIIVGSGASGSFAAYELTARGLKVLMLEAGREMTPDDFDPGRKKGQKKGLNVLERAIATLRGQPMQARAVLFRKWQSHLFVSDRKNPYTTPKDAPFLWIRARQRGGRLHSYGRVLMRWSDAEFKCHSLRGAGCDWPISYDELAPFYDEVERMLELRGNHDGLMSMPDGVYSHPAPLSPAERTFQKRVEQDINSRRVVAWRQVAPEPSRLHKPLREALQTGRLTLLTDSIVRKVQTDPVSGRATGIEYTETATGDTCVALGRSVVLCASPVETVRLLWNSANNCHPNGIGNAKDQLGRYFMDQLPLVAQGDYPPVSGGYIDPTAPQDPFYDASGGIFIPRNREENFTFQGMVGRGDVDKDAPGRMAFFGYGEMEPSAENRITLDPRKSDAWGIPVAHIRCKIGAVDETTLKRQAHSLQDIVKIAGGRLEFLGSPLGLFEWGRGAYPDEDPISRFLFRKVFPKTMVMGAAIHESGGARMGSDPAKSVLDRWNRCWDAPNLIVGDASAFAGSGVTGTTLTVMAMTLRACRKLAADLESGSARGV